MTIESLLLAKSLLVLSALVVFGLWERVRPVSDSSLLIRIGRATRAGVRRVGRNLGLFGVNALISPLIVLPITVWSEGFSTGLRPSWWSGGIGVALDILLLDFWLYWWHRANHEVPFLWRFHQVHHLDETLDVTTALRFHGGEVVLSAVVRAAIIILFDVALASVILFEGVVLAAAIFHHSDSRLPPRLEVGFSRILITPGIHWVHHHARRADTDSNYGTIFSFWDPIFGSRSRTKRWSAMPIGVERLHDRSLVRLFLSPFIRQAGAGTNELPQDARR